VRRRKRANSPQQGGKKKKEGMFEVASPRHPIGEYGKSRRSYLLTARKDRQYWEYLLGNV